MKTGIRATRRAMILALPLLGLALFLTPSTAVGQTAGGQPVTGLAGSGPAPFSIKPVAEKKLTQLPAGPLYWRLENFPTLALAQAVEKPNSLAAEVGGKVWLITLGPKGGATPGGTRAAEIGPLPVVTASEYLLKLNNSGGAPGAATPVHTHAGSESFYVMSGQLSQKTSHGTVHVDAGGSMAGHGADLSMVVSSSGKSDLSALVLFLVDANKPFATPSKFN
jgi:hypothetical protein